MNCLRLTRLFICFSCCVSVSVYAVRIDESLAKDIETCLAHGNASTICRYPLQHAKNTQSLTIAHSIAWNTPATLELVSTEDIIFEEQVFIRSDGLGSLVLKAGMENKRNVDPDLEPIGTLVFKSTGKTQVFLKDGAAAVYYNPVKEMSNKPLDHRYHYPRSFKKNIDLSDAHLLKSFMLINNLYDLQDMLLLPSGNYALSQDIDATDTRKWQDGKGFEPIKRQEEVVEGFSGDFDGNHYRISNLYINRPDEDHVGLFGRSFQRKFASNRIENLILENFMIQGGRYTAALLGSAHNMQIKNIKILNSTIQGKSIVGAVVGGGLNVVIEDVSIFGKTKVVPAEYSGLIFGSMSGGNVSVHTEYGWNVNSLQDVKELMGYFTMTQLCVNNSCLSNMPRSFL